MQSDVYLWIAIILGIISIVLDVLHGFGLQKLRVLSTGLVAAMFVQPVVNANAHQQAVFQDGIISTAPVAVTPVYPPPVCLVTIPTNLYANYHNPQLRRLRL
ncbi:hypothetical protein Aduo_015568 [Ancylostoma duodenale]